MFLKRPHGRFLLWECRAIEGNSRNRGWASYWGFILIKCCLFMLIGDFSLFILTFVGFFVIIFTLTSMS